MKKDEAKEEREYGRLCDDLFNQLEELLDEREDDIDFENNGDVCEITLPSGAKIIVNRQSAMKEIWLAAKSGGFHFRWKKDQWIDTRDGTEFFSKLESCLNEN